MKKIITLLLAVLALIACSKKPVETFNEAKPLTLEITKERSYYQADRIVKRLSKMGLEAYILEEKTDAGEWYRVMSGALADSVAVVEYTQQLDSLLRLERCRA